MFLVIRRLMSQLAECASEKSCKKFPRTYDTGILNCAYSKSNVMIRKPRDLTQLLTPRNHDRTSHTVRVETYAQSRISRLMRKCRATNDYFCIPEGNHDSNSVFNASASSTALTMFHRIPDVQTSQCRFICIPSRDGIDADKRPQFFVSAWQY
jgi:hypothetical protein